MKIFLSRVVLFIGAVLMASVAYGFEDGQTVRLECGGRSLMVENSTLDASKAAVLWTETGTNSQRWVLEDNGRGLFYLRNVYSGYYLGGMTATSAGSQVGVIEKSAAQTRGTWVLEPVEGEADTYIIYFSTLKRYAVASLADVTEGSTVSLQAASTTDAARIKWKVTVCDPRPNYLTPEVRDDMMDR
ncbi:MAG: RICIN domain-containing protein, partial [Bacteroidaceae bacterium]|nr:RICIN domain-containing protein [Bacteroidaceae bacterium]